MPCVETGRPRIWSSIVAKQHCAARGGRDGLLVAPARPSTQGCAQLRAPVLQPALPSGHLQDASSLEPTDQRTSRAPPRRPAAGAARRAPPGAGPTSGAVLESTAVDSALTAPCAGATAGSQSKTSPNPRNDQGLNRSLSSSCGSRTRGATTGFSSLKRSRVVTRRDLSAVPAANTTVSPSITLGST